MFPAGVNPRIASGTPISVLRFPTLVDVFPTDPVMAIIVGLWRLSANRESPFKMRIRRRYRMGWKMEYGIQGLVFWDFDFFFHHLKYFSMALGVRVNTIDQLV